MGSASLHPSYAIRVFGQALITGEPEVVESTQHKLDRVRPPRVQITYDLEKGDAIEKKELPFVLGVMADLGGMPAEDETPPPLKERRFVNIDRDNFDEVMKGIKPRLAMQVDNQLAKDGTRLGVELRFRRLADFEPEQVVKQVEPLRKLLEARSRLAELRNKMVTNDKLAEALQAIINDTEKLQTLGKEVGHAAPAQAEG
jgi:type VI secretion system protein ImpB